MYKVKVCMKVYLQKKSVIKSAILSEQDDLSIRTVHRQNTVHS